MLPKPQNRKAIPAEEESCLSVSPFIEVDLHPPERAVGVREVATTGAAMPETAIYKNNQPLFLEIEIRSAQHTFGMHFPAANSRAH